MLKSINMSTFVCCGVWTIHLLLCVVVSEQYIYLCALWCLNNAPTFIYCGVNNIPTFMCCGVNNTSTFVLCGDWTMHLPLCIVVLEQYTYLCVLWCEQYAYLCVLWCLNNTSTFTCCGAASTTSWFLFWCIVIPLKTVIFVDEISWCDSPFEIFRTSYRYINHKCLTVTSRPVD